MGSQRTFVVTSIAFIIMMGAFSMVGSGSGNVPNRASFVGGDGSPEDPYQIADLEGLQYMSADLGAHYILVGDIDAAASSSMNGGLGFLPVGDDSTSFTGSLEGDGFEISSLFIDRGSMT
ncbi:MAG: hypothetical protein ACMUHU_04850, partial [Thermoplasmatota archaeon]